MRYLPKLLKYLLFLLFNSFFWIAVYFFYTYFLGYGSSNIDYVNQFSINLMPVTILLSYFVILVLIPKYLLKKRYLLFSLYSVYTFIISFTVIVISIFYGLIFSSYLKDADSTVLTKSLPLIILGVYFVVLVATLISLLFYSYQSQRANDHLTHKFLETQLQLKEQELRFLKMQIHPHFLFNSLNTIYGYALQKKDRTPEMILKLSSLLDYILYQIDRPTVLLQSEIKHIEDYIALEKIRFHDTLQVHLKKNQFDESLSIAPMLLIPFVENSFKHGTIRNGALEVHISIGVKGDQLHFTIKNTTSKEKKGEKGIGLENIKKRLNLLYKNQYTLNINKGDEWFTVVLEISLKNKHE